MKINKNCNIFGTLEFGGLSNYWGLQIDKNILGDLNHLNYNTKKKILKSFVEIFKKFNLLGNINLENNKAENEFKKNDFIYEKFSKKNKNLYIENAVVGFQKKRKSEVDLNSINETKDKLTPINIFKKHIKKNRVKIHNFCVKKIRKYKNLLILECSNGKVKKRFITKKLVLGCGTITTTKLILDFLKIYKEIKIKHHPRLFCLYLSKKAWENNMKFQPSYFHLKPKKNKELFTADFRPGNDLIIDALIKFKKILFPFRYFLNLIKKNLIFSSILYNTSYSNLFIKLRKNNEHAEIYSKNKNLKNLFKRTSKLIYNFLKSTKIIFPFYLNYFPGFGSDFHYFGTIPIKKKNNLSVNDKCQLLQNKNIYLVDGSVFEFKKNKYPLGVIMANSRRIAKEI